MNLRTALAALGWVLICASLIVLGKSILYESTVRSALEGALPAGVLLALAGHMFTQSKTLADAEEKRSSFNLVGFRQAYDHAHTLLADKNNRRATWIEAARSLAHGEELAKAVTVNEHKRVLELERLKYRGLFSQFLEGSPAEFFYGVPPALFVSLDEAAKASTASEVQNGRTTVSTVHELDGSSVRMVWLAASWPKGYDDPLGTRFSEQELGSLMLHFPQLHRFLEHKKVWTSAAGKLFPRHQR